MRIAQMLDNLGWGGAQKMQLFLVETLQPLGIEMTVISLSEASDSVIPALLKEAGAHVVAFPFRQLFSPLSFARLVSFMRQEKFDLLHAYLTRSNIIGSFAGSLSSTPVIASLRSTRSKESPNREGKEKLENFAMRYLSRRVLANGNAVAAFAHSRLGESFPIDIIPNAVPQFTAISAEERHSIRTAILDNPDRILIMSVGRVVPVKGFPDLIQAFAKVRCKHPSAVLAIVGGGYGDRDTYPSVIRSMIENLGLQDCVKLIDFTNEVPRLLAAADLYVNSSLWEGTPVSVLEAMSAGLPIVATAVGESPYLLSDGVGILVPPGQASQLADAISELLASPKKRYRLGRAAFERVARDYNRYLWGQRLLELYCQLTPKAKPYLDKYLNGKAH
jgi:glycosyltransferase involved in cell wall biosynthesis